MIKINKKLISITLVFALVILLSTISYAKPFTEAFKGGLIQINNFFVKEQYGPYAKTIDFFVFAILFISIYMAGVKYAFKEVKKPEKAIAVVLGFTTSLLLVLGGYSITALLPFLNWLLYFLLFVLMWWLLKDMKSKLWRFILALLLTILLIALFQLLFWGIGAEISCPGDAFPYISLLLAILLFIVLWLLLKDIKNGFGRFLLALLLTIVVVLVVLALLKGSSIETACPSAKSVTSFFEDFTNSLKGVDIGGFTPSTPEFLRGLTSRDIPTPSPPSGLLKQIEPPKVKEKTEEERGLTLGDPKKAAVEESALGKIFDVNPSDYTNQDAYNKAVIEAGKKKKKIGGTTYYLDEKSGQLYRDRSIWFDSTVKQDDVLKEKQRIEQEKVKSAENLGLFFGVRQEKGMTSQEVENAILKAGEKRKDVEGQKYYSAKKDDKLVLKRERALYNPAKWFGGDEVIDPEQPEIKKTIDDERKRREPEQPLSPGTPSQPATSPTPPKQATGQPPPGETSWVGIIGIALALGAGTFAAIPRTRKWAIKKWKTRGKERLETTIPEIIAKIDKVKNDIEDYEIELARIHKHRTELIRAKDKVDAFIAHIKKRGVAWLHEKGEEFEKIEKDVNELILTEEELIDIMRILARLELDFLKKLEAWGKILSNSGIKDAEQELVSLSHFIRASINSIREFYHIAEKEFQIEEELKALLNNREELIKRRFDKFIEDETKLSELLERDGRIITRLIGERA